MKKARLIVFLSLVILSSALFTYHLFFAIKTLVEQITQIVELRKHGWIDFTICGESVFVFVIRCVLIMLVSLCGMSWLIAYCIHRFKRSDSTQNIRARITALKELRQEKKQLKLKQKIDKLQSQLNNKESDE